MLQKIKKAPFLFFLLLLTGCGSSSNNSENANEDIPQAKKPHAKNYGELLLVAGSTNLSLFKGDIEKSCTDVVVNAANPWLADGGGRCWCNLRWSRKGKSR